MSHAALTATVRFRLEERTAPLAQPRSITPYSESWLQPNVVAEWRRNREPYRDFASIIDPPKRWMGRHWENIAIAHDVRPFSSSPRSSVLPAPVARHLRRHRCNILINALRLRKCPEPNGDLSSPT